MERFLLFIVEAFIHLLPKLAVLIKRYFRFCNTALRDFRPKSSVSLVILNSKGKRVRWHETLAGQLKRMKYFATLAGLYVLIPVEAIIIIYIFFRYIGPYILPAIAGFALLAEWREQQIKEKIVYQQVMSNEVAMTYKANLQKELLIVLNELGDLLPIHPLNAESEIEINIFFRDGVYFAVASVLKGHSNPLTENEKVLAKARIQAIIKNHLDNGLVYEANFPSLDNETPLLFIESVEDAGMNLRINIVIADTPAAIKYIHRPHQEQARHGGMDRDF